jgi:hypothetical protein
MPVVRGEENCVSCLQLLPITREIPVKREQLRCLYNRLPLIFIVSWNFV